MVDHYAKVQRDVLQDAVDVMSKVLRKAEGNGAHRRGIEERCQRHESNREGRNRNGLVRMMGK